MQHDIRFIHAKMAAQDIYEAGIRAYYAESNLTRDRAAAEIDKAFRELAKTLGYSAELEVGPDQEERERFAAMSPEEREYEIAESRSDDAYQAMRERAVA